MIVILNNIRSAFNVGAIFRTADGAGVEKLYLTGTTPAPIDRFGREQPGIKKTALGAVDSVPWEVPESTTALVDRLRSEGYLIVAVEQAPNAIPYTDFHIKHPTVFVFGNEVFGLSEEFLKKSDVVIEIPMSGQKESLNVATTAGVILFHARDH
jgi:23S rRNA (guanosine2251-2'-O)-methyltransferase